MMFRMTRIPPSSTQSPAPAEPVLVLQHMSADGPAYLATWLAARGRRYRVFDAQAGEAFPATMTGYAALAVLGGEMGANDDLPALRQAQALIREAFAAAKPVVGHCLGGQLMARAFGAAVTRASAPEIGWHPLQRAAGPAARAWFGEADGADPVVFQWHYDQFALPSGAERLASSPACPNQAFAIGPHLALQFHVELDAGKLGVWSQSRDPAFVRAQARWPTVQGPEAMRAGAARHLAAQQRLADRLYRRWLPG